MDDHVADAVAHQHRLLAEWLGSRPGESVLAELSAAHTADFTLVTVDGAVLDRDALLAALASAAGARPGLRIEITDLTLVAQLDDAVLVRFLETHRVGEQATARWVSALLRTGDGRPRWAYVHETAVTSA